MNFENKTQINRYDGEGLRHEMEENGRLVKFLYHDREAVAEEKEDGKYIRYIRGYDLVASDSECARTYYHYASDEQGSITHVLGEDENGEYKLKNYYEYGAFGDFREQYEEAENRFGYNGEIFDPIGGQYYLRARYYNPVIGRFTQEDTYYGAGLNLYAYCRNLPVGYIDPSGHYPCQEKQDLYKKYREQGMTAIEANWQANYELIKKKQGKKAADKYLNDERKKYVVAAGNAKAVEVVYAKKQGKKAAGPCLSTVYDPITHQLYYGQNYKSKSKTQLAEYYSWLENDADPIIKERTEKYAADIAAGKVTDLPENHDSRLAAHSEVRALDQALKVRRDLGMIVNESTLSELYLYNIDLWKMYAGEGIIPKDRCANCSRITDGVNTIGHK